MRRADSLEKILRLGKIEGGRKRARQSMRWLDGVRLKGHESEWTPGVDDGQGGLMRCGPGGRKSQT